MHSTTQTGWVGWMSTPSVWVAMGFWMTVKDWMCHWKCWCTPFMNTVGYMYSSHNFTCTCICKHAVYSYFWPLWDGLVLFPCLPCSAQCLTFQFCPCWTCMNPDSYTDFWEQNWYTVLCVQNWHYPCYPWSIHDCQQLLLHMVACIFTGFLATATHIEEYT